MVGASGYAAGSQLLVIVELAINEWPVSELFQAACSSRGLLYSRESARESLPTWLPARPLRPCFYGQSSARHLSAYSGCQPESDGSAVAAEK